MLKNNQPHLLSIEAIVQKASIRKSVDEIPSDMKKLFLEEVSSKEFQKKISDRKMSKFFVNQLTFNNPVQPEGRKIPPLPTKQVRSKSLNTSKNFYDAQKSGKEKPVKKRNLQVIARKSLGQNVVKKQQKSELQQHLKCIYKESEQKAKEKPKKKNKITRFEYELEIPTNLHEQRKKQHEKIFKITEAKIIQNKMNNQQKIIMNKTSTKSFGKRHSANPNKIPDFIMKNLPIQKTQENQQISQPMKSSSHIKFPQESFQQFERKVSKPPKCLISMKQKTTKKPKTADSEQQIIEPHIKFVRLQKKQKYKTIHLKSSENLPAKRVNKSEKRSRKKAKEYDDLVCGWQVTDNPNLPQYY